MGIKKSVLEALCIKIMAEMNDDLQDERGACDEVIRSMTETPLIEQAVTYTLLGMG